MASTGSYPDPDSAQMGSGSAGLYVNQNGGGMSPQQQQQQSQPPPQQQPQHVPTDPDLQLQENLSQHLQRNAEMNAQAHQMNQQLNAHHQLHTPPRPAHSPQQMAQSVMSLGEHNPYGDHDLGGPTRKRSKVSRACDECRRKKIRCDATSENGPEACSSCKRTGARCQFSRQPMKRGPSKGYIKELADRLNTLESQIASPSSQPPPQHYDYLGMGDQGLTGLQDLGGTPQFARKRTHSMSEGLQDSYAPNHRASMGWSGQDTRESVPPNGSNQGASYRRPSYGDVALAGSLLQGSNEGVIKAYYNTIHQTLPILPLDSAALNRLTNCPPRLREAFFLALECAVRSFAPSGLPSPDVAHPQMVHRALVALEDAQRVLADNDNTRHFFNQLVYCQGLLLLAFASDNAGPSPIASPAELLGRTFGRMSDMGVNDAKVLSALREQDHESFQAARRLFWVTFILDRFHASSMSKDIQMPLFCGSVSRDDNHALGDAGYHLARGADIVGQIAHLVRTKDMPNVDPSSPYAFAALTMTSPTSIFLNGQLSRYIESLDASGLTTGTAPYLTYQFLRILVARVSEYTAPNEVLGLTRELLDNLIQSPPNPLNYVFASLVAASLTEAADRPEIQLEAFALMNDMDEALANGQIIHRSTDGQGWDVSLRNLIHQKKTSLAPPPADHAASVQPNMAGLQHLAAAAVGEREGADAAARPTSSGGNEANTTPAPTSEVKIDVSAAMAAATEAAEAAATEAAAAQATAAAAQKQLQSEGRRESDAHGMHSYDTATLVKDGFMNSLTQQSSVDSI